jgi:hypothetical protein
MDDRIDINVTHSYEGSEWCLNGMDLTMQS